MRRTHTFSFIKDFHSTKKELSCAAGDGGSSARWNLRRKKRAKTRQMGMILFLFCLFIYFFFILPISLPTVAGYCEAVCAAWRLHCLGQPPAQCDGKVLLSIRVRLFGSCHYHGGINGSGCDDRPAERPFYRSSSVPMKERRWQRLDAAAKCRWTQAWCKNNLLVSGLIPLSRAWTVIGWNFHF